MHELAIAQSILGIVEETVRKNNATDVTELELEIGVFAGIEYESLEFALKVISNNSILSNAVIVVIKPEGKANCLECGITFRLENLFATCPGCNGYKYKITEGKELRVKSLVIN
jgi:hydrogenase nickel incorporation protein HypA/HybF